MSAASASATRKRPTTSVHDVTYRPRTISARVRGSVHVHAAVRNRSSMVRGITVMNETYTLVQTIHTVGWETRATKYAWNAV
jgi:hypothetical protein